MLGGWQKAKSWLGEGGRGQMKSSSGMYLGRDSGRQYVSRS